MTPCIEHTGYRDKNGYGRVHVPGTKSATEWAHRWAWRQAHGPIPAGMFVLHSCDNPPCVNVEHLRLGTHLDNMADVKRRGRHYKGRLSAEAVHDIRTSPFTEQARRELGLRYGVSTGTVGDVQRGRTYRHLPVHYATAHEVAS